MAVEGAGEQRHLQEQSGALSRRLPPHDLFRSGSARIGANSRGTLGVRSRGFARGTNRFKGQNAALEDRLLPCPLRERPAPR